jgi:hypothetical protein
MVQTVSASIWQQPRLTIGFHARAPDVFFPALERMESCKQKSRPSAPRKLFFPQHLLSAKKAHKKRDGDTSLDGCLNCAGMMRFTNRAYVLSAAL